MRTARAALPALAAATALALAGCGGGGLGQQARTGDQKAYVAGDGTYKLVPAAQRGKPVALTGRTADGAALDVASMRGHVVVVNVWYAGCAPCRAEAPDLARIAQDTAADGVQFVGVNTRDDAGTVQAFDRRYAMPYPSVLDADSGAALLSLRGTVPPQAVPSTVVLDAQGRPAARYLGRIEPDILSGIIEDVQGSTGAQPAATAQAAG